MSEKVAEPLPEYYEMEPLWMLTSALRGGTPAMRAAGKAYLPMEPRESPEAYNIRLQRSVLTNHYDKAVGKLSGKPHRKPITLVDGFPAPLVEFSENITNTGVNLDVFSRRFLEAAIDDGVAHVLVDMPPITERGTLPGGEISIADQRRMNLRPYASIIRAKDLIGWKSTIRNGEKVLTQIRIQETITRPDPENEFTDQLVDRIKVVEPFVVRHYEKIKTDEGEEWRLVETLPTPLGFIPIATLYTDRTGFMTGKPWLIDLAYLNLAHYQSDSDQRNILHVARVPILFGTGFGDEDDGDRVSLTVGVSQFARGPKGATLQFVEHGGKGIESGRADLQDLELRMQLMAMEPVIKGRVSGDMTATQRAMDQSEEDTELGALARNLENALETVFQYAGEWLNIRQSFDGMIEVFKDFGTLGGDTEALQNILALRANGDISRDAVIEEFKRRGVLSDDFDVEEDGDLLELEGPSEEEILAAARADQRSQAVNA